jgi:hypothetical protein
LARSSAPSPQLSAQTTSSPQAMIQSDGIPL